MQTSADCHYAGFHALWCAYNFYCYAEYRYVECRGFIVRLSVIMPSAILLVVVDAECRAVYCYAESALMLAIKCAKYHAECCYSECRYAERHYA
jgi:hypothetical protein